MGDVLAFSVTVFDFEVAAVWHSTKDGSECGWSAPELTDQQRGRMVFLARLEAEHPWFTREQAKEPTSPADAEALLRGAILSVARMIEVKVSFAEASELASLWLHSDGDSFRSSLCLLPGWHTNTSAVPSELTRAEYATGFFTILARRLLLRKRRWWQHPRWHVHHWRVDVPIATRVRCAVFDRCAWCERRFAWSEPKICIGDGERRWFKSRPNSFHQDCYRDFSSGSDGAAVRREMAKARRLWPRLRAWAQR